MFTTNEPRDIRMEELRLQGVKVIVPQQMTPEMEIDQSLDIAQEAIERALSIFDTNDIETTALLDLTLTLIARVQRRLS